MSDEEDINIIPKSQMRTTDMRSLTQSPGRKMQKEVKARISSFRTNKDKSDIEAKRRRFF